MGGSPLFVFRIKRSPPYRSPFRIATHMCSRTRGCSSFITRTTPPYRGHWLTWAPPTPPYLPPWAPGYVPHPSNYDVSLLPNCNDIYIRNFILWQTAIQKQKIISLKRKYLLQRLMQMYMKKNAKVRRTWRTPPTMQYPSVSVDSLSSIVKEDPGIVVQECVMTPIVQEQQMPVDLSTDNVPDNDNIEPSLVMEVSSSSNITSYVNVEPGCIMSSKEQEQISPVDLSRENYVEYDVYSVPTNLSLVLEVTNSPRSPNYVYREEPEYNYRPPEYRMFSVEQEQLAPVDLSRESYAGDDVFSVPSPGMEVTINDDNNNEEYVAYQRLVEPILFVEETRPTPGISVLVMNMEMAREM